MDSRNVRVVVSERMSEPSPVGFVPAAPLDTLLVMYDRSEPIKRAPEVAVPLVLAWLAVMIVSMSRLISEAALANW